MNKFLAGFLAAAIMHGAPLCAQDDNAGTFKPDAGADAQNTSSPSPSPAPDQASAEQGPTVITAAKESTFDGKTKVAVLIGDVKVINPQFTLSSDKLTVYFHKADEDPKKASDPKKQSAPGPSPAPKPAAPAPAANEGGGIEKVVAEGQVTIDTDRADPAGGPPVHYSGKGTKVEYTPATGEMILSGLPQLQKGTDTLVATEDWTVIYLSRDGHMDAKGPHKITISDPGPDKTPQPKQPETQQSEMR